MEFRFIDLGYFLLFWRLLTLGKNRGQLELNPVAQLTLVFPGSFFEFRAKRLSRPEGDAL